MAKQGLSFILIIILVLVSSSVTVADNHRLSNQATGEDLSVAHSCHADAAGHSSSHHASDAEEATHHNDYHTCCHGHTQVASLVASDADFYSFSLRHQHVTEYRFVVTAHCPYPDYRPPIV